MKKNIKTILWLALIVLIGFRLRLIGINKPSGIWFDEMIVYIQTQGSFPVDIIRNASINDILMPLYHLLLAIWIKIFGNGDLTLRMFSAVLGALAIIGAFLTGNRAKDNKAGYIAAILFALNGCAIYFSQEIKFYILAMFFSAFNLYFFLRVSDDNKDKLGWIGLITTCVLGCYTFSIYMFLAFTQFLYLFIENIIKKENLKYFWINSGITFVLLIPFLWLNLFITHNMKELYAPSTMYLNFDLSTVFYLFQSWLTPFTVNKVDNYIHYSYAFLNNYTVLQGIEILLIMCLMIFFMIYGMFKNKQAQKLGILGFSFILITYLSGFILKYCLTVRYGVLFVPFFVVLSAIGMCEIKVKWLRKTLISFLIVLLVFINVFDKKAAAKANRGGLKPIADVMQEYKLGKDDIMFFSYSRVDLFNKYYDFKGMLINAPVIYNEIAYKSFGVTRSDDIRQDFRDYLMTTEPTKGEKEFFNLNINNKEHKGHYIMLVKGKSDDVNVSSIAADDRLYYARSFYFLPPFKFMNNIIQLCEEEFGPGKFHDTEHWRIFVYKIK